MYNIKKMIYVKSKTKGNIQFINRRCKSLCRHVQVDDTSIIIDGEINYSIRDVDGDFFWRNIMTSKPCFSNQRKSVLFRSLAFMLCLSIVRENLHDSVWYVCKNFAN